MAGRGLATTSSLYDFTTTLERLEAAVRDNGMTVFARFDHAANAIAVGLALPPTTVLVFGNAAAGTKLMQVDREVALELPLRILVWQDADGTVRITHDDPHSLAANYVLGNTVAPVIGAMSGLLAKLAASAAG